MAQIQGSREEILVSAYNEGYQYYEDYKKSTEEYYAKLKKEYEDKKRVMQILGYTPVGWLVALGIGFYNGIVGLGQGIVDKALFFAQNIKKIFQNDADPNKTVLDSLFSGEMWDDIMYMFTAGFADDVQGLANGVVNFIGSVGNMFGNEDALKWASDARDFIESKANQFKETGQLTPTGAIEDAQYAQAEEDRYEDWFKDAVIGTNEAFNKAYADDPFAPYMDNSKAYNVLSGTFQSIGRLVPSFAISSLGSNPDLQGVAKTLSTSYFYATTYGQAMNEGLNNGLSISDANVYAKGSALIETLTEEMGGFKFGEKIAGGLAKNFLDEAFEEVVSELATAGQLNETSGETWTRVGMAGLAGGLAGGLLAGGNLVANRQTLGVKYQTLEDVSEMLNMKVGDSNFEKVQVALRENLDEGIKQLNKVVNRPKELSKTLNTLSQTPASSFIQYNETARRFELTQLGQEAYNDIGAKQDGKSLSTNGVFNVGVGKNIRSILTTTNKAGKEVKVDVKIVEKGSQIYNDNKTNIDKIIDMSKRTGLDVVIYEGAKNSVHGFYSDGVSYVNASYGSEMMKQVAGHELLHAVVNLYRKGKLSQTQQKAFDKLSNELISAIDKDPSFKKAVFEQMKIAEDKGVIAEEALAHFIEKYVNMDEVIDKLLVSKPTLMQKIIKAITGLRVGGKATSLEQRYINLLNKIKVKNETTIRDVLLASNYTFDNPLYSRETLEKITIDGKIHDNAQYFIKVNENGETKVKLPWEDGLVTITDKDILASEDVQDFKTYLETGEVSKLIDNFLASEENNHIGFKYVMLQEYLNTAEKMGKDLTTTEEDKNNLSNNYVNSLFSSGFLQIREALYEEIDKRLLEIKNKIFAGQKIYNKDLIKVDYKTFRKVMALNYLKIEERNFVSLFPENAFRQVPEMYLRSDFQAGFLVNGSNYNNSPFNRGELASIFNTSKEPNKRGFVKHIADFAVNELGATNVTAISHFAYEFYYKIFKDNLQLNKTENKFYQQAYDNGIMASEWSILYSNWIVSEITKQRLESVVLSGDIVDTPVYNNIYDYTHDLRFRDGFDRVITANVVDYFKHSKAVDIEGRPLVLFHGTNSEFSTFLHEKGLNKSYGYGFYFTDNYEVAKTYGVNIKAVYLDIRKPLSVDERQITKVQISELIRNIDKNGTGMLSFVGNIEENTYEDLVNYQTDVLNRNLNDLDLINEIIELNNGYDGSEKIYNILREKLGYDGTITRFWNSDDMIYVAFNSNQIKSVDNMKPTNNNDVKLSQEGMFDLPAETLQQKLFNINIAEKFAKQGFVKVTDENLVKKGYMFKNSKYPFYISKEAMTFPKPYVLSNIDYYVPSGSYTFIVANTLTGEKNRINFYPDFVDEKTGKVIKNAHFLMFGAYPDKILLNTKNNIGLEQSVALEDLSKNFFSPTIFVDNNKSVYVILKNKVISKGAFVSDLDVYSHIRVYDENYIMFFAPQVSELETKEEVFELRRKIIDSADPSLVPLIEKTYGIYNINGKDTPTTVRKMTVENAKKYFYRSLDFLFKYYLDEKVDTYKAPNDFDFNEKATFLSTLKNLLVSEQTTLTSFKSGLENYDYLPQFNQMFENLVALRGIFYDYASFIQEIKNPTSVLAQSIVDYVLTLPFQKSEMVREAKMNIDYKQDVAYVIVQDENMDAQFVKDIQDNIGDGKVITINSFSNELFVELYNRLVSHEIDPSQTLYSKKGGIENQLPQAKTNIEQAKRTKTTESVAIVKSDERVEAKPKVDNHFYTVTYDKVGKKKVITQEIKEFAHLNEAKAFARTQINSFINRWWSKNSQDKGFGKLYFATNALPPTQGAEVKSEVKKEEQIAPKTEIKVEPQAEIKVEPKIEKPAKVQKEVKNEPKKAKPTVIPSIPADVKVEPFEIDIKEALRDLNRAKNIPENKKKSAELEVRYQEKLKEYKVEKGNKLSEFVGKTVEMIEGNILNQNTRERIYNHQFVNVAKYLAMNIADLASLEIVKPNQDLVQVLITGVNRVVANTQIYLDSVFRDNDTNILDPTNPNGFQYTKKIYWGIRDIFDNPSADSGKVKELISIYQALAGLDLSNPDTLVSMELALKNFRNATNVNQTNGMALDSRGEFAHTIPNVIAQFSEWIDTTIDIIGHKVVETNKQTGKRTIVREKGILGKHHYFDDIKVSKLIADPFTFAEVTSFFMPNGAPQVMLNRIYDGSKKQLKVTNVANEYFEKGGWLKANSKKIDALEKNYVNIKNLRTQINSEETGDTNMVQSQVVSLYNTLKREIVRNMLIDEGYIRGIKTHHFDNNNFVRIADNTKNRFDREANSVDVKIIDQMALLNELQEIIFSDKFLSDYNKKIMGFFNEMYEFVNFRFKDINGLELPNDAQTVKEAMDGMTAEQKQAFLDALPKHTNADNTIRYIELDAIYIPYRNAGHSYMNKGAFDADTILDLGIFDGITQSLTESNSMLLIDSINNVVPAYSREVSNYFGLYRVVRDLNELFGAKQLVEGTIAQEINLAQQMSNVNPFIVEYFEKLVKDIAGYAENKKGVDKPFAKIMASLRKNFFKASLALNFKVIATQFASVAVLGANFGSGANPFTNSPFMMKFTKNLFMLGSKTKAKYLVETSDIYKARARMSTYEVGQATDTKWNKNLMNQITEFLMSGITMTDNMINRAFFITLRDTINPETGKIFTDEEAKNLVELGIYRHQSSSNMVTRSELLRSQNDIVKVFTKFLSEPMKILTNIYGRAKRIKIISLFEKNKTAIEKYLSDKVVKTKEEVETYKADISRDDAQTQTKEFNALPEAEQEKFNKKLEARKKALPLIEYKAEQKERIIQDFGNGVTQVIAGKKDAKTSLFREVSAFAGSFIWQVMVGVIFSQLLRGKWRDKPEDEEMWEYLAKVVGQQMAFEFVGYFPVVRDMYSVLANGFSFAEIDEISALDDLVLQMRYLTIDILNGKEFNAGRHIRQVAISLGSALGIPVRNIERVFTTPLSWISDAGTFTYKDATGQRVDVNKTLATAVRNQDEKLIESVIRSKMNDRNLNLGKDVINEIERLAMVNGKTPTFAGNYGSFTVDGVEYNLTDKQKEKFTEVYNKADYISAKIIQSAEYKQLNDEYKAKMLTAIFNYYYRMAKQEVSGIEQISDKFYFVNLIDAYQYFVSTVAKRLYNAMVKGEEEK